MIKFCLLVQLTMMTKKSHFLIDIENAHFVIFVIYDCTNYINKRDMQKYINLVQLQFKIHCCFIANLTQFQELMSIWVHFLLESSLLKISKIGLTRKLKELKRLLKEWNYNTIDNVHNQVTNALIILDSINNL